jgi:hypothetical protein
VSYGAEGTPLLLYTIYSALPEDLLAGQGNSGCRVAVRSSAVLGASLVLVWGSSYPFYKAYWGTKHLRETSCIPL